MIKKTIETHPDLFDKTASLAFNEQRGRLYTAVLFLMKQYFVFDTDDSFLTLGSPVEPGEPIQVVLKRSAKDLGALGQDKRTDKIKILAVTGALISKNLDDPSMGRDPDAPPAMNEQLIWEPPLEPAQAALRKLRIVPRFVEAVTRAVQNYNANRELYEKVYSYLREVGESPAGSAGPVEAGAVGDAQIVRTSVFASQVATVVERLVEQRVSADAPQIRLLISCAVGQSVGCATGRSSGIDIDLPDLDSEVSVEIQADNVRAQSVLYFAAQLEDMRFFAVADQICYLFQVGQLPLTRSAGADNIFEYLKSSYTRFNEVERRGMYARSFGFAQGGVDEAAPNRDFSNLWIRALSSVSAYSRQSSTARIVGVDDRTQLINLSVGDNFDRVHHMQVYKTLRDLSVNLSLHGYGMAHYGAIELQDTIRKVRNMLSHPDVLSAFGVRDYFQLVERVAQMYMGSEVNSLGQRVQAQSGSQIIQWIADRADVLSSPRPPRADLFLEPTLVNNVEKWLAVTGTTGQTLQRYAQPVPVTQQPTIPGLQSMRSLSAAVEGSLDQLNRAVGAPATAHPAHPALKLPEA